MVLVDEIDDEGMDDMLEFDDVGMIAEDFEEDEVDMMMCAEWDVVDTGDGIEKVLVVSGGDRQEGMERVGGFAVVVVVVVVVGVVAGRDSRCL